MKSLMYRSNSGELEEGKLPPQAKELEEAVLGAILIESDAINDVYDILTADVFYTDAHQRIYRAISELKQKDLPIDTFTVIERLKSNGDLNTAGGQWYIIQLCNKIGSSANIVYHARIIIELFIKRAVINVSSKAIRDAFEDSTDSFDLVDEILKDFDSLQKSSCPGTIESVESQVNEAIAKIQCSGNVQSKHSAININLGGWQKGNLYIVAARPGIGKSAFHVSEIMNALENGSKCASFNPEMTKRQLISRMLCNLSGIQNNVLKLALKTKFLSTQDELSFSDAEYKLKSYSKSLTMDFTGGVTVDQIVNTCKKVKLEKGLDIVFVDYLQLITLTPADFKGTNRDQQIGMVTRKLKSLAKNQDLAVVVFCALNRLSETKADKRPGLADLRESGNIENDADGIIFLVRPEHYFKHDHKGNVIYENAEQEEFKNICQAICLKNREDTCFEAEWMCYLGTSNFIDLDLHYT